MAWLCPEDSDSLQALDQGFSGVRYAVQSTGPREVPVLASRTPTSTPLSEPFKGKARHMLCAGYLLMHIGN